METFDDAAVDAEAAGEALRGLAHASRVIGDPADTYSILGALASALASLGQSLDQLATWHDRNAGRATDDHNNHRAGRHHASAAAEYLRDAATGIRRAQGAVDEAWNHNGRIAWQPDFPMDPARREPARGQHPRALPPASAFGADTGGVRRRPDPPGR